jgi:uncharacterized membrane protein YeaQ/YmgE (transglycosylase-associated protein family)
MPLLVWIMDGLVAGWLTGKMMPGEGGDLMMGTIMGLAGAVAGGFIVSAATLHVPSAMFYANLAAIQGALVLTALYRLFTGKRQYATQR